MIIVDIPNFPGYRVDSDGYVWSLWILKHRKIGTTQKKLKPYKNNSGYLTVTIMRDTKRCVCRINRIVCEAFHGPPPTETHEAAHQNGIRTDNRAVNLKWKTRSENVADMILHKTQPYGELHGRAKLTEKQAVIVYKLCQKGNFSKIRIGQRFGITRHQVQNIASQRQWKHISKGENSGDSD